MEPLDPNTSSRRTFLGLVSALFGASVSSCGRPTPPLGSLTVLVPSEPDRIDPRFTRDALSSTLSRLVFSALYEAEPTTFELVPTIASALPSIEGNGLRVIVPVSRTLTFQDGTRITNDDVAATFQTILDPAKKCVARGTYAKVFKSVSTRGDAEVVFELNGADGTWPSLIQQPILRGSDARRGEILAGEGREAAIVGSGVARVVSMRKGVWEFEAVTGPNGAGHTPGRVRFVTVRDPNTLALRLMHGEADAAEVKPELFDIFRERPGFGLRSVRSVAFTYVGVQHDNPFLAKREVRQAIAHALDRAALVRGKFGEHAVLSTGPLPPSHWAYEPDVRTVAFDPTEARRILSDAGQSPRLVLRTSNQRFILVVAQAISEMLRDVGIEVLHKPSDQSALLEDLRHGRFDLCLLTMPDLSDPWGVGWLFASSAIPTAQNNYEGGNRWHYKNPQFDGFIESGRRASDRTHRAPLYRQAQKIFAEDLPVIPLWHADIVYVSGPRIAQLQPRPDAQLEFLFRAQLQPGK